MIIIIIIISIIIIINLLYLDLCLIAQISLNQ